MTGVETLAVPRGIRLLAYTHTTYCVARLSYRERQLMDISSLMVLYVTWRTDCYYRRTVCLVDRPTLGRAIYLSFKRKGELLRIVGFFRRNQKVSSVLLKVV
jgi:hypothetical protein